MQRQFNLQPSLYLAILLIAAHAAALMALYFLPLPSWALAALTVLLLSGLGFYLRRHAWLTAPSSGVMLQLDGDRVVLTARSGDQLTGQLSGTSLVTPLLTVLNVLPQGEHFTRSVIILPDSLDPESFRQLRVLLKWGR